MRGSAFCFRLLPLVRLVTLVSFVGLVSVLGLAYLRADHKLTSTLFAVVLYKADGATDSD